MRIPDGPDGWLSPTKRRADIRLLPGLERHLREWQRQYLFDLPIVDGLPGANWQTVENRYRQSLAVVCQNAGLPIVTPSETRHTVRSLLRGLPGRDEFLGHGEPGASATGLAYEHRTPDMMSAIVERLSSFMGEVAAGCDKPVYA